LKQVFSSQAAATPTANPEADKITPELVRQVADKVFAMLMRDLKIELERSRPTEKRFDQSRTLL
jgi:hypothetical protein